MNDQRTINSSSVLNETERHFRVFAGPGAGKTYWLINHIKSVIRKSNRLSSVSRVACISYTNVAAQEIRQKLGAYSEFVEVSTIHSFLFRFIVKPYLHLLLDEKGESLVAFDLVSGHDEHYPNYRIVKKWIGSTGYAKGAWFLNKNRVALYAFLKSLSWYKPENSGDWELKPKGFHRIPRNFVKQTDSYKRLCWNEGVLDHEDVLYFAYRILEEFPGIRKFLGARFPYIFVDEFQDTHPVQTQIVHWLADSSVGTMVGVIGDSEQSIYGFIGAEPKGFTDFSIEGHIDYEIPDNRRSTDHIISLLNHVRKDDLLQKGLRSIPGKPVSVLVGDIETAIHFVREELDGNDEFVVLARKNREVHNIRADTILNHRNAWTRLEEIDDNRFFFLRHLISAIELTRSKTVPFGEAVKTLIRGIRINKNGVLWAPLAYHNPVTSLQRRLIGVSLLRTLCANYGTLLNITILQFYQVVDDQLSEIMDGVKLKGVRKGNFQDFASSNHYFTLASTISLTEDSRDIRTIHKAKSSEFDNVLLFLSKENRLEHILNSDGNQEEERRVTYVALSRARDRLFISVPTLTDAREIGLMKLKIQVLRI